MHFLPEKNQGLNVQVKEERDHGFVKVETGSWRFLNITLFRRVNGLEVLFEICMFT